MIQKKKGKGWNTLQRVTELNWTLLYFMKSCCLASALQLQRWTSKEREYENAFPMSLCFVSSFFPSSS